MNCPHVSGADSGVRSQRVLEALEGYFVKQLQHQKQDSKPPLPPGTSVEHDATLAIAKPNSAGEEHLHPGDSQPVKEHIEELVCKGCRSREARWACLTCGEVNCGRFVQGHALAHYQATKHPCAIELDSTACYCYACDEYAYGGEHEILLEGFRKGIGKLMSSPPALDCDDSAPPSVQSIESNIPPKSPPRKVRGRKKGTTVQRKYPHITGLSNLGNTCFMNVVMQTLCHTVPFQRYYLENLPPTPCTPLSPRSPHSPRSPFGTPQISPPRLTRRMSANKDISVWAESRALLREMWGEESSAVSPGTFLDAIWKNVPMFRGYQQQDAQEFIRYLLDRVHTEVSCYTNATPITKVFQGTLHNEVRCLRCRHPSLKTDPFLDLSLPIPERFASRQNKVEQMVHPCTVDDCLRAFTEVEELADSERYDCPNCYARMRGPQRCTKRLAIDELPEVLCLHLKRFRFTNRRAARSKIDTYVQFPIEGLDMRPFVTRRKGRTRTVYDLYSIIVHHGSSGSGHYIAFVWSPDNGTWFELNDTHVRPTSPDTLVQQSAYMLFYVRRPLPEGEPEEVLGDLEEDEPPDPLPDADAPNSDDHQGSSLPKRLTFSQSPHPSTTSGSSSRQGPLKIRLRIRPRSESPASQERPSSPSDSFTTTLRITTSQISSASSQSGSSEPPSPRMEQNHALLSPNLTPQQSQSRRGQTSTKAGRGRGRGRGRSRVNGLASLSESKDERSRKGSMMIGRMQITKRIQQRSAMVSDSA
ncbi:hypothetical protein DFS34DRAFT_279079 [Phlyctochytrium arcticum]|nr:hypothetical protein DFS34DRAFT_279079 [Phlyctochytrium arcticum]